MKRFIVESNVSGQSSTEIAENAKGLETSDRTVIWVCNYVTERKIYTLVDALNAEAIRLVARRRGYAIHHLLPLQHKSG